MAALVEVRDLHKRYRARDPWAVQGVTFALEPGRAFGLLGPNGAGKSTVVKAIVGLTRPDSGTVALFGLSPSKYAARAQVGFAPEEPDFPKYLRADEVLDYFGRLLGLSASKRRRRVVEALEWSSLAGERRQVRHFSKGMKQGLGLAQAILGRPKLLILDEPTADLDPIGRRDVRELIAGLKAQGTAVLLNSHLLSEVERVCDRVAIMARGRILKEADAGAGARGPDPRGGFHGPAGCHRSVTRTGLARLHRREAGAWRAQLMSQALAVARYSLIELTRRRVLVVIVAIGVVLMAASPSPRICSHSQLLKMG